MPLRPGKLYQSDFLNFTKIKGYGQSKYIANGGG